MRRRQQGCQCPRPPLFFCLTNCVLAWPALPGPAPPAHLWDDPDLAVALGEGHAHEGVALRLALLANHAARLLDIARLNLGRAAAAGHSARTAWGGGWGWGTMGGGKEGAMVARLRCRAGHQNLIVKGAVMLFATWLVKHLDCLWVAKPRVLVLHACE